MTQFAIRFGLLGIKSIGKNVSNIIDERSKNGEFVSIFDFCKRSGKDLNKKMIEAFAKSGAINSIHNNQKQIFESWEILSKYISSSNPENTDQMNFLSSIKSSELPKLVECENWSERERLDHEFESLGFYLTGHPLDSYEKELQSLNVIKYSNIDRVEDGSNVNLAGVVMDVKHRSSGKGRFCYLFISDPSEIFESTIFSEKLITDSRNILDNGKFVVINALVKRDNDGSVRIIVNNMAGLENFLAKKVQFTTGASRNKWQGKSNSENGGVSNYATKNVVQKILIAKIHPKKDEDIKNIKEILKNISENPPKNGSEFRVIFSIDGENIKLKRSYILDNVTIEMIKKICGIFVE